MKIRFNATLVGTIILIIIIGLRPSLALAQGTTFPDVPANHWAYQAVTDLANEGYVKGYPDASFLGKRALTRYEFATVIDRIVATVADLSVKVNGIPAPVTPNGAPVTQDDLNKIQVLVDTFQPELDTIKANISGLSAQLDSLRSDIVDAKASALKAQAAAGQAQSEADNSYGAGVGRKFSISGLIQTRFVAAGSDSHSAFTQGLNNSGNAGGIAAAFNGTYAEGGTSESAEVRRARIVLLGQPTDNLLYKLQVDVSGAVNNYAASNSQITVFDAYGMYTFGNGSTKYPSVAAGQFPNPFGYLMPMPPGSFITPERPLAFNQTNNVGLFDSQDYDKGAKAVYAIGPIKATYALVTGSGRQAEDIQDHFDSIAKLSYASPTKIFAVDASYYGGYVARARGTGDGDTTIPYATQSYAEPKKDLYDLDGQVTYQGFFADYEFVRGTYEKRSYFDAGDAAAGTNPLGFETDNYVKNNQVQGSYVWGGYTFFGSTPKPLVLAFDYDTFQRSMSSQNSPSNAYQSTAESSYTYYESGSSFDDINSGFGVLYNVDRATRLRLWYETPFEVAHAPGTPQPPRYGLYTAEMQIKF